MVAKDARNPGVVSGTWTVNGFTPSREFIHTPNYTHAVHKSNENEKLFVCGQQQQTQKANPSFIDMLKKNQSFKPLDAYVPKASNRL